MGTQSPASAVSRAISVHRLWFEISTFGGASRNERITELATNARNTERTSMQNRVPDVGGGARNTLTLRDGITETSA